MDIVGGPEGALIRRQYWHRMCAILCQEAACQALEVNVERTHPCGRRDRWRLMKPDRIAVWRLLRPPRKRETHQGGAARPVARAEPCAGARLSRRSDRRCQSLRCVTSDARRTGSRRSTTAVPAAIHAKASVRMAILMQEVAGAYTIDGITPLMPKERYFPEAHPGGYSWTG